MWSEPTGNAAYMAERKRWLRKKKRQDRLITLAAIGIIALAYVVGAALYFGGFYVLVRIGTEAYKAAMGG